MGHEPAVLHRRPSRCEGQGGIARSGGQHALDDWGSLTIHKTGRVELNGGWLPPSTRNSKVNLVLWEVR
jgi:hypothetical protein